MPYVPVQITFNPGYTLSRVEAGAIKAAVFNHYLILQQERRLRDASNKADVAHLIALSAEAEGPAADTWATNANSIANAGEVDADIYNSSDWLHANMVTFVSETFGDIVYSVEFNNERGSWP